MTGTIEHWDPRKFYGFIRPEGTTRADARDLFFHVSAVDPTEAHLIDVGARVSYEPSTDGVGRPRAERVQLLLDDNLRLSVVRGEVF